ncbi:hypothetical protein [Streptomyces sp. NPDC051561]|uniref:hypothetical protein n=1 Tax=Streptomyces sp. NPDC051561 TaxID=3365658 RepID=UPI0037A11961
MLARGGDIEAEALLQRKGFIPVVRAHDRFHRLPHGLDVEEEVRRASRAVALLTGLGYHVDHEVAFAPTRRELHDLPLGAQVASLAQDIRAGEHSEDVTAALTELVAPGDGVLPAVVTVLTAAAEFLTGLGQDADPHHANRLRQLGEYIERVEREVGEYRNDFADRHMAHPLRTPCAPVAANEREASVSCSCPLPAKPPPAAPPPRRR